MNKNKVKAASVISLFVAYFLGYFIRCTPSVVMPVIQEELQLSSSTVGMITSLYLFSYSIQQFFLGPLFKKYTSERICGIGMIIAAVGLVLFGMGKNVVLLIIGRMLLGLGTGPFFIGLVFILQNNFSGETYVRYYGYSYFASNLGSIISSTPLSLLINKFGRNKIFYVLAAIAFIFSFVLLFLAKKASEDIKEQEETQVSVIRQIKISSKQLFTSKLLVGALLILLIECLGLASYQGLWCMKYTSVAFPSVENLASLSGAFVSVGVMISAVIGDQLRLKSRKDKIFLAGIMGAITTFLLVISKKMNIFASLAADILFGYANGYILIQFGALIRESTSQEDNANIMSVFNGIGGFSQQLSQWFSGFLIDVFAISCLLKTSFDLTYLVYAIIFALFTVSSRYLIKKD